MCKGDKHLEDEECSGRPSEVDNDQLREIIDADPLKTTRKIAEELKVNHSTVVRHLKQIGWRKQNMSPHGGLAPGTQGTGGLGVRPVWLNKHLFVCKHCAKSGGHR